MRFGGAESTFLNIIKNLDQEKFELYLITFKKPCKETWQKEYFSLPEKGIHNVPLNVPFSFLLPIPFAYQILKHRPSLIFSTLLFTNFISIISNYLLFKPSQNIIREDTIRSIDIKAKNSSEWMARFVYKYASKIITLSHASKEDILNNFNVSSEKITVFYNFFDFNFSDDSELNKEFSSTYPQGKTLVCVGRFYFEKNQLFLLKSFRHFLNQNPGFKLLMIGSGEDYFETCKQFVIENSLEENVTFLGVKTNALNYMQQSDLLICPSIYEGFGRVMIEALGAGTRVLAKKNPGSNEVLGGGKYGLLCDTDDEQVFALSISEALKFNIPADVNEWLNQFRTENVIKEYNNFFLNYAS